MPDSASVIQGVLVDAKNINIHKSIRLSIDVPAEFGAQIVKAFGWPTMAEPVAVAVARLNPEAVQETSEPLPKEHRPFKDLPPSTQSAIACNDARFRAFLHEVQEYECATEREAADYVRYFCEVDSRAKIKPGTVAAKKWAFLCSAYLGWQEAERVGA